jgi:hypothetical protein
MAKTNGAVFDFNHIAAMINWISDISEEGYQISLTREAKLDVVRYVLSHYYDHIMAYSVSVSGSDPYKFLAWAGVFIYENLYKKDKEAAIKFLSSSVAALNRSLLLCDKTMPEWYLRKALKMVVNEFDNGHHIGLGKNGLYMAFKGPSLT